MRKTRVLDTIKLYVPYNGEKNDQKEIQNLFVKEMKRAIVRYSSGVTFVYCFQK